MRILEMCLTCSRFRIKASRDQTDWITTYLAQTEIQPLLSEISSNERDSPLDDEWRQVLGHAIDPMEEEVRAPELQTPLLAQR